MEAICNPIPEGSLENKASQLLDARHGNCYSDIEKLQSDLKWLDEQGFINHKKFSIHEKSKNYEYWCRSNNDCN